MPFYTFRCCKCSHEIEVLTKSSDKEDRMCPKCGCAMRRKFPLVASPGTTRDDGGESGGGVGGGWTFGKQTGVGKLDGVSAEESMFDKLSEASKEVAKFESEGGEMVRGGFYKSKKSKKDKK